MSEFMKKHPIISLLMVGSVVGGIVDIVKFISIGRHLNDLKDFPDVKVTVTPISEEEENDEPASDI